jgi:protein gp37
VPPFDGYGADVPCGRCRGTGVTYIYDWVIVGGESGHRHRALDLVWMHVIACDCQEAGIPVFVKQDSGPRPGQQGRIPDGLWSIKQFPDVVVEPVEADGTCQEGGCDALV